MHDGPSSRCRKNITVASVFDEQQRRPAHGVKCAASALRPKQKRLRLIYGADGPISALAKMNDWDTPGPRALHVERWGAPYFSINGRGHVVVRPDGNGGWEWT